MSVAGRHAAEAGRRTVRGAGAGLRRLSDRETTLLIDRLRPACSLGSMTCLPGIAPGGRGVRRFRGRVRVPQGQGHAPNPRLGEGAPQPRAITCTVQAGENHTIITLDNTTRPPENAADAEDLIQPFHRGDDTRMANRPGHDSACPSPRHAPTPCRPRSPSAGPHPAPSEPKSSYRTGRRSAIARSRRNMDTALMPGNRHNPPHSAPFASSPRRVWRSQLDILGALILIIDWTNV